MSHLDSTPSPIEEKMEEEYIKDEKESLENDYEEDSAVVKKLIRKIDYRLLPILGAMYAMCLIDRTNLSNVRINGADVEIGLADADHYSIATLAFFPPYTVLEIFGNILCRRTSASLFLGTIGVLWGAIMICMGFVKTWQQLTACRALLGALEASFFPACVWLISCWYKRYEIQVRLSFFYLTSALLGSFSNILAWAFAQIDAAGLSGWRWILIIEGIATCCLGILGYFIIVDFPDKNKFLTKEETAIVKERIRRDRADGEHDHLTLKKCMQYSLDPKLWGFALLFGCATTPVYAYGYFITIIIVGMGYSVKMAQLLAAPTGVAACIFAIILARLADKYRIRGPIVIFQAILTIIGLSLTAYHPKNAVRFAGAFIGSAGTQGNIPAILAYQSNNIRGQSKRAFASALQVGFGGVGGIIASLGFRQKDYPRYRLGSNLVIGLECLIIIVTTINTIWFLHSNRLARQGKKVNEGQPGFMYTI